MILSLCLLWTTASYFKLEQISRADVTETTLLQEGGSLELTYETEELRDLYRVPATALACFGPSIARALAVRFADLRAVQNASELVAFNARSCTRYDLPTISVPVTDDCSIILVASHPKKRGPAQEWADVNRVKIIKIGRHDEQDCL